MEFPVRLATTFPSSSSRPSTRSSVNSRSNSRSNSPSRFSPTFLLRQWQSSPEMMEADIMPINDLHIPPSTRYPLPSKIRFTDTRFVVDHEVSNRFDRLYLNELKCHSPEVTGAGTEKMSRHINEKSALTHAMSTWTPTSRFQSLAKSIL